MAGQAAVAEAVREPEAKLPADVTGVSRKESLNRQFQGPWDVMERWRPKWLTIGTAMMPARPAWCVAGVPGSDAPPAYGTMMDSCAVLAARTASSGFASKLSNPQSKWFGLTTTDPELDAEDDVERWFSSTAGKMYAVMDRSNYYAASEQVYLDAVVFSTASMDIQPDKKTIIRCTTHPIGDYAIACDERGRVNHWERQWQSTAFQLFREYGQDNLPADVLQALKQRDYASTWTVRHMVYPNDDASEEYAQFDNTRMPFRECYWLRDDMRDTNFAPLAEGFYAEWPVPCPRWGPVQPGGVWGGFSPGFIALPDVLMLYAMKIEYLNAMRKKVTPPTVSGNAFKNKKVWTTPGANNVDDQTQGDPQLRAAYAVNLELQHVAEEMRQLRSQIEDAFYRPAMMPMLIRLQNMAEQPTALQSGLARDEAYALVGPVIEGFSDQFHDLSIDRIFGIMWRAGMIDPPPERLRGKPLRVVLKSEMANAQRAVGVAALERHLQFTGAVASMWGQNALDNDDPDALLKLHSQLTGVDPIVRRTDSVRDAIRAERIKAQQMAMAAQAAPQIAKATKDMTDASVTAQAVGVN